MVFDLHPSVFPLEEFVPLALHQDLVPEACACYPVGSEGLLGALSQRCQGLVGPRGAPVGQPSSFSLVALAAALRVGSRVRPTPGLLHPRTPFPHGWLWHAGGAPS
jgi:hypothetical protein